MLSHTLLVHSAALGVIVMSEVHGPWTTQLASSGGSRSLNSALAGTFTDKSVCLWAAQMHKCSDKFIRVSDSSLEAPWRLNVVRANLSEVRSRS